MSKKKTKRKPPALRPPPLSWLDKTVYTVLIVVAIALGFGALWVIVSINRSISYKDPTVISSAARGTMLWAVPFLFTFILALMGTVCTALTDKQPIFGKKGIAYGSIHYALVYPLFMKNRPKAYIRPSEKRYRRFTRRLVLGVLVVTFLLTPLSLYGRNSLREDMSITVYGVFDQEKRQYEREDIETVTFGIYHAYRGVGMYVRAAIRTTDGKRYDFGGDLDTLLYIKRHVPASAVRYKNEYLLDALIRGEYKTPDQAAKVRSLFGK